MDTIAIIVPCYNEQEVLEQFHRRTEEVLAGIKDCRFRYVFVNDGSRDRTLPILRRLAERTTRYRISAFPGISARKRPCWPEWICGCDAAVIMDADLQHPPEMIPEMIGWWRKGYDDVCAKRADRKDEGFIKRHLTNFFYKLLQKCSRTAIQRNVGISASSTGGASRRSGSCGKASATRRDCSPGWDLKERDPLPCTAAGSG